MYLKFQLDWRFTELRGCLCSSGTSSKSNRAVVGRVCYIESMDGKFLGFLPKKCAGTHYYRLMTRFKVFKFCQREMSEVQGVVE